MNTRFSMIGALTLSLCLAGCSGSPAAPVADDLQRYVQENPDAVASSEPPQVESPLVVGK